MENYMNAPVKCEWTPEDIVREFGVLQDKKKVAKIFQISIKEVTEILKAYKGKH